MERMDQLLTRMAPASDSRQGNVIVFLSLFLMVLAFFIVLVSISTFETVKSKAVMQSLNSTFATFQPRQAKTTDFTAKEGEVLGGQVFQEKITGLFATAIQVAKVKVVKPGRLMRIQLPARAMFSDGDAAVKPSILPFLDRIAAALGGRPPGIRFDMEFVIGTPYGSDGMLAETQTLERSRAGGFAREMLARGAPEDSISIGLAPGDAEQITLRFYVRQSDDVRLEFLERQRAGPQ
jgi:hypothetical protein